MLALADQEGYSSLVWSRVPYHISPYRWDGPPPAPPILAQRARGHGPLSGLVQSICENKLMANTMVKGYGRGIIDAQSLNCQFPIDCSKISRLVQTIINNSSFWPPTLSSTSMVLPVWLPQYCIPYSAR